MNSPELAPSHLKPQPLSVELATLAGDLGTSEVRLRDVVRRFEGRVYTLFLVLLSLPFCQPIALPGLSTPFGMVISFLGLRYALRKKPWIPQFVLNTKIQPFFFSKILKLGGSILARLEKLLHPRWDWMFTFHVTQFLSGWAIFICGCLLLLPLPVPFSNLLPAMTVILLAASLAERDGLTLVLGLGSFLVTLAFFVLIFWGGAEVVGWLQQYFHGFFDPKESPPDFSGYGF
jgi:hypothetical protein